MRFKAAVLNEIRKPLAIEEIDMGELGPTDVLVRIGEEAVTGRLQLYEAIWRRKPGDSIDLKVLRDGHIENVTVNSGDAEEFFSI